MVIKSFVKFNKTRFYKFMEHFTKAFLVEYFTKIESCSPSLIWWLGCRSSGWIDWGWFVVKKFYVMPKHLKIFKQLSNIKCIQWKLYSEVKKKSHKHCKRRERTLGMRITVMVEEIKRLKWLVVKNLVCAQLIRENNS